MTSNKRQKTSSLPNKAVGHKANGATPDPIEEEQERSVQLPGDIGARDRTLEANFEPPSSLISKAVPVLGSSTLSVLKHPKRSGYPRASKACDACRKQKTRCLASNDTTSCLRCLSMKMKCSFEEDRENSVVIDMIDPSGDPANASTSVSAHPNNNSRNVPLEDNSLSSSMYYHMHNQQGRLANRGTSIDSKLSYLQMGMNEVLFMLRNNVNNSNIQGFNIMDTNIPNLPLGMNFQNGKNMNSNDVHDNNHSIPLLGDDTNISKILQKRQSVGTNGSGTKINNNFVMPNFGLNPDAIAVSGSKALGRSKKKRRGIEMLNEFSPRSFLTSPYFSIGQMTNSSVSIPQIISDLVSPSFPSLNNINNQQDLISLGILTYTQAKGLLQHFKDRYGRWVTFPESYTIEMILDRLRIKCPFFITVTCTLALKYSDPFLKERVYKIMLEVLRKDLSNCFLSMPLNIEFLQSLCVLSLYGVCLSSDGGVQLDNWLISGLAIQHFLKMNSMGLLFSRETGINNDSDTVDEYQKLTIYRLWNHLSLVHLINCIVSGRPSISEEVTENLYLNTLNLASSTNFDGRIVAEIQLHIMTYLFLHHNTCKKSDELGDEHDEQQENRDVDLLDDGTYGIKLFHETKDMLDAWLAQWGYLFEQPANEFVSMAYHFAHLLVTYNWAFRKIINNSNGNKKTLLMSQFTVLFNPFSKDANGGINEPKGDKEGEVDEDSDLVGMVLRSTDISSLNSMIYHSQKILDSVSSVEDDSYFAFLSDQIRISILFTSLVLIKLTYVVSEKKRMYQHGVQVQLGLQNDNTGTSEDGTNIRTDNIAMSSSEIDKNLNRCFELSTRFRIISTDEFDAVNRFSDLIQDCLQDHFPDFARE